MNTKDLLQAVERAQLSGGRSLGTDRLGRVVFGFTRLRDASAFASLFTRRDAVGPRGARNGGWEVRVK